MRISQTVEHNWQGAENLYPQIVPRPRYRWTRIEQEFEEEAQTIMFIGNRPPEEEFPRAYEVIGNL